MAERTALDRNLHELEDRARQAADWRTHHRNHPGLTVSLAFGAGMVLGLLSLPSSSRASWSRSDERDHPAGSDPDQPDHPTPVPTPDYARDASSGPSRTARAARTARAGLAAVGHTRTVNRAKEEVGETWGRIADTLLVMASAKAIEFVADLIPGFSDQFDRRKRPSAAQPADAPRYSA